MKLSEIYREAAYIVATSRPVYLHHRPACSAIALLCETVEESTKARKLFEEYFKPKGAGDFSLWFGPITVSPAITIKELRRNKVNRITALLFMNEIAKDLENESFNT